MLGVKPVKLLVKLVVPVSLVVFVLSEISGLELVLHTTPLVVTFDPPFEVKVAPLFAELPLLSVTAVVVNSGTDEVLKDI